MNREIKFRAWDKKLNIMWEAISLTKLLRYLFLQQMPNATAYTEIKNHFEEVIWLESTGLKDKNEKEIFEGDIVRADYTDRIKSFEGQSSIFVLEIKYDDFMGGYKPFVDEPFLQSKRMEIIGNIYENPELLS